MAGKKTIIFPILVLVVIILIIISRNYNQSKVMYENSYKPMIKVNNTVYGFSKDINTIDKSKLESLGKIMYSYNTINFAIKETDKNFTSNVYEKGLEVYRYSDNEIIVIGEDFITVLKKIGN